MVFACYVKPCGVRVVLVRCIVAVLGSIEFYLAMFGIDCIFAAFGVVTDDQSTVGYKF